MKVTFSDNKARNCIAQCVREVSLKQADIEHATDKPSQCKTKRKLHQKVVAFSFYGDLKPGYYRGIKLNLDLMQVGDYVFVVDTNLLKGYLSGLVLQALY